MDFKVANGAIKGNIVVFVKREHFLHSMFALLFTINFWLGFINLVEDGLIEFSLEHDSRS